MAIIICVVFSIIYIGGYMVANKMVKEACNKTIKIEKNFDELRHILDYDYQDWGETL